MKSCDSDFIILIDALRYDFIDEKRSPFLYRLKKAGIHGDVLETYAFQTRPAYFAGLEPQRSNVCNLFQYDPDQSPFGFLRKLEPVASLIERSGVSWPFRKVIKRIGRWSERRKGNVASAEVLSTDQIPLNLLHFFSLSEKRHSDTEGVYGDDDTIFDAFRRSGKTWSWFGYPRDFGSTTSILSRYRESSHADVVYMHFSEIDWVGHRFGPDSAEMDEAITQMDNTVREVLEEPLRRGRRAVIFGDHGMVKIKYVLDLKRVLGNLPLKLGHDYLYFLDSTQVRLWFFTSAAEDIVREALTEIDGGRVLDCDERKRLGIDFADRRYGDMLFAVDGPGLIHPSFFSRGKSTPLGMHGYMPSVRENATQVIAIGSGIAPRDLGTIEMTEIYHIILETLVG